jgi:hypothetical protein
METTGEKRKVNAETRWRYGDAWEKYPIREGEIWRDVGSGSMLAVGDLRRGMPGWMNRARMLYIDPPWNQGNVNAFVTKAGRTDYVEAFEEFYRPLFAAIRTIAPDVCYLEVGRQHLELFEHELRTLYPYLQTWGIRYYKKHICYLLRGGHRAVIRDYSGMDDEHTPAAAIEAERPASVGDLCTGRGLTTVAACRAGVPFFGIELNRRRLAVAIERANKLGASYARAIPA